MESRFEFTFSYWLFTWFVIYIVGWTTYNPKIWLILAALYEICILLAILYYGHKIRWVIIFIVMVIVLKFIPLWVLRNTPYRMVDFISGCILYILFLAWMTIRLGVKGIFLYHKGIINQLIQGKPFSPLIRLLHEWKQV